MGIDLSKYTPEEVFAFMKGVRVLGPWELNIDVWSRRTHDDMIYAEVWPESGTWTAKIGSTRLPSQKSELLARIACDTYLKKQGFLLCGLMPPQSSLQKVSLGLTLLEENGGKRVGIYLDALRVHVPGSVSQSVEALLLALGWEYLPDARAWTWKDKLTHK